MNLGTATPVAAFDPSSVDVAELERRFRQALAAADPVGLPVVGFGEISIAFGWPPEDPSVAVKSLPVFEDLSRLQAYADLIDEYVGALGARGVEVLPTAVRWVDAPGGWRGFLIQPLLDERTIGSAVLRAGGPDASELVRAVVDRLFEVIDERVGLDAQFSNWAGADDHLWYLDVGTPMLRDAHGHDRLDVAILATAVPWLARGLITRVVAPGILTPYHDPRLTVLDTAGNLIRERLPGWIPRFLEVANARLERPLSEAEVTRFYRWNARVYTVLQAIRRADRAWQRHVRRRPYPFLLPDHYER